MRIRDHMLSHTITQLFPDSPRVLEILVITMNTQVVQARASESHFTL